MSSESCKRRKNNSVREDDPVRVGKSLRSSQDDCKWMGAICPFISPWPSLIPVDGTSTGNFYPLLTFSD